MECPNCAFQNTPGTVRCVRCAGRLDFSDVDVVPLRASKSAVARAATRATDALGFGARDAGKRLMGELRRPRWLDRSYDGVSPGEFLWCVVPGLAQIRRGHRMLGYWLMAAWGLLLLLGLLTIGSGMSVLAALGGVSVHCLSVTLLLAGVLDSMPLTKRAMTGLVVYALVVGVVYVPIYWVGSRFVRIVPVVTTLRSDTLRAGDVLIAPGPIFGPAVPRRGDIVLYRVRSLSGPGVIVQGGQWIDRVLGLPGDRLSVAGGVASINGVPIPHDMLPLGSLVGCPDLELQAGPGQYIILPTLVPAGDYRRFVFSQRSLISAEQIQATLAYRLRPWLRAGRLNPSASASAEGPTP